MSDRAAIHRAVDPGRGRRADEGSPAPTPCEDPCGGFGDEARGSRRPFWLGRRELGGSVPESCSALSLTTTEETLQ